MTWYRRRETLRFVIGADRVRAEIARGENVTWAAEQRYGGVEQLAESVAELAQQATPRCRRAAVEVERPPAQIRTLRELPPVKPRQLKALVVQGVGRFFRRNGVPLSTDALWVHGDRARVARAAAAPEPLLEAVVTGTRVASLTLEHMGPRGVDGLAWLPASERRARRARSRRALSRLSELAGLVWLVAGLAFLARLVAERQSLSRNLAQLQPSVATVISVRRRLHEAQETLGAVTRSRAQRGSGLAMLAVIAATLPDSAVVTSLVWRADSGARLVVAARHAEVLPAAFARAGVPARLNPSHAAPLTTPRGWRAFQLRYDAVPRAPPAPGGRP